MFREIIWIFNVKEKKGSRFIKINKEAEENGRRKWKDKKRIIKQCEPNRQYIL